MDTTKNISTDPPDLSTYSLLEACYWLLESINISSYMKNSYSIPYINYLLTWPDSVPLNTIIMAQSPYPNNIYAYKGAAMSYDEDLAEACVNFRGSVPPTVEILANDLYINGGMNRKEVIHLIKDGWMLVNKGILLVNECIFNNGNPLYYTESANQCYLIKRLLEETEKYGKRTVTIFALGESGEKMASNLCSWYKSPNIKLTKYKATHPAAISRRISDFSSPACNLGDPKFSKKLAEVLSNHVALIYTMSKRSEKVDPVAQRQAELIKTFYSDTAQYKEIVDKLCSLTFKIMDTDIVKNEDHRKVLTEWYDTMKLLSTRMALQSSIIASNPVTGNMTSLGSITKSSPSLGTVNPSTNNITNLSTPAGSSGVTSLPLVVRTKKRGKMKQESDESFDKVSIPDSVQTISTAVTNTTISSTTGSPLQVRERKKKVSSVNSTPVKDTEPTKISSVKSANFRKIEESPSRVKSKTLEKVQTSSGSKEDGQGFPRIADNVANQLSCIDAVVEAHKDGAKDDSDTQDYLETIQNDIVHKQAINGITQALVTAIQKDIKEIEGFNFADWIVNGDTPCNTFQVCKEYFEF